MQSYWSRLLAALLASVVLACVDCIVGQRCLHFGALSWRALSALFSVVLASLHCSGSVVFACSMVAFVLSRKALIVLAILITSAATGSRALPPTTQHGYPRRAVLTAVSSAPFALALVPCPAAAKLLNPAVTWTQQEQLMRTHAARFEQSTPVAVRTTSIARRRLRELVATVDLPAPTAVDTRPPMLQPCRANGLSAPASVPEALGSSCGLEALCTCVPR